MKSSKIDAIEVTDEPVVGNASLATIGRLLDIAGIDQVRSGRNQPNYKIKIRARHVAFCGSRHA
jgi:hypothetical protein